MSGIKSMLSVCVVVVLLGVGAYFLFPDSFSGASWPLLFVLLACLLCMIFMWHGGKNVDNAPSSAGESKKK